MGHGKEKNPLWRPLMGDIKPARITHYWLRFFYGTDTRTRLRETNGQNSSSRVSSMIGEKSNDGWESP
jgi:hypothetical protein